MEKVLILSLTSLLFSSLSTFLVSASEGLVIGNPVIMSGSGCPSGSVETTINSGEKALSVSVVFSEFSTVASPGKVAHKHCSLRMPVQFPQGFQAQLVDMVYRGFADIPSGGSGQIVSTAILGGKTVGQKSTNLPAEFSSQWELTNGFTSVTFAGCPTSTILGVNTSTLVRAINASREAQIATDSVEITGREILAKFNFKLVPCI
jgi:hypothetical protein